MNTKLLRQKILDLAIRGKLTDQRKSDGSTADLLKQIVTERVSQNSLIRKKSIVPKSIIPINKGDGPFEIPNNWEWVKLGDLSESIQYGYNAPAKECGRIKMVRISDIHDNEVKWESVPFCDIEESEIQTYQLKKDDILFARTGGTVGKSYIVNDIPEAAVYAGYLIRTRYSKNINAQFMKFFMESNLYWEQLRDGCIATAQPNCNGKTLGNMFIPLPPLEEQQRIVAKIEEAFAEIDAIEKNKELLKTHIKQTRQKILDLAIHGKLVPQDENDEPASILLEKILQEKAQSDNKKSPKRKKTDDIATSDNRPYKKNSSLSVEDAPFDIPNSWEWVKIGDVCDKLIDGDHNPPKGISEKTDYLMLSSRNINNDTLVDLENARYLTKELFEEENKRTELKKGDILFTSVGSLGRSCIYSGNGNFCFQRSVSVIHTLIENRYLKYFFDSNYYQQVILENATGTAQLGFYLEQMRNSCIAIPPLAEQKRIASKVESLFSVLDAMEKDCD
ncbi:MAG: restriction endonuclease subunit S [Fibrobacter sp.]|nr:restriction endonuclease subunit S [Fibrobacter sp.]